MKTVRPTWLAIAVAVAILTVVRAAAPAAAQQPDRRPNIVFLFADDWGRYAHCYAAHDARPTINSLLKTPHLDGLAREGVLFRNAFVPSPSCTPCRSSVLSGQYFFRTGRAAILLGAEWDPAIPSFPLLLRDAGYQIGKSYKVWSPGKPADAPYGGQSHAFEAAGTRFNRFSINASRLVREGMTVEAAKKKLYDEVRGNVRAFLAAREPGRPFCYWFGPTVTHRSWEKGSGQALWGIDPDALQGRLPGFMPDVPEVRGDFADYMGEIQAWDAAVGVILAELQAAGALADTLVVASGDHGMPGVPGGKCNLYDHGVAVPLLARGPGIAGGRVVDDFVNLMDLAPTFLEAGGVAPPAVMTGRSLLGVLRSGSSGLVDESRTWVVTGRERHVDTAREGNLPYPHRALRTRDHLYIRNFAPDRWPLGSPAFSGRSDLPAHAEVESDTFVAFPDMDHSPTKAWLVGQFGVKEWAWHYDYAFGKRPAEELYDLRTDPEQMRNLADDPAHAAVRQELAKRLIDVLTAAGDPRVTGAGETFDRPPFTDVAPNSPGLRARRLQTPPAPAKNDSSAAGGATYRLCDSGRHPVIPVPMLPRRRHEIGEPVQEPERRELDGSPDRCDRIPRDRAVRCEHGQLLAYRRGHENPVEGITVDQRQVGGCTQQCGVESFTRQCEPMPAGEAHAVVKRREWYLELARLDLDGQLPGHDGRQYGETAGPQGVGRRG